MNKLVSFSHGSVALSFDDVVLVPARSAVLPVQADVSTKLTKKISLKLPIVSAAMDTVTESRSAIAMAVAGGIGVIHRNNTPEEQASQVLAVKKYAHWVVQNPECVTPSTTIAEVRALAEKIGVSGFPVVENGKLVGIITGRDLRFVEDESLKVSALMRSPAVSAPMGIDLQAAKKLLQEHRIEKLPLLDEKGFPAGLVTHKDLERFASMKNASLDSKGMLLVGGAVGPADLKRAIALVEAGVDCLVIDTAHGHSTGVLDGVKKMKNEFPQMQVIAGNISTREAAEELISQGADAIKTGQGPGSICTTRVVSGAGMPQLTAILECAEVAEAHSVPVIADGGIRFSGDIAKAIAAGASSVMLGSLLAGTDESPGRIAFVGGRKYKQYRGMGSVGAMMASSGGKSRYNQEHVNAKAKLVPEGVEGMVAWKGPLSEVVYQLVGGLKSGMGYCGCANLQQMRKDAKFAQITNAGNVESHPHGIIITDEAPNYNAAKQ